MFYNLIVLVLDAIWVPLKMLNLVRLPYAIEDRVGQIILIGWYGAEFSHLLLSLNRFFAITAPLMYHKIFSNQRTVYFVYGIFVLSACMTIPYSFHKVCTFYLEKYFWLYLDTPFCNKFSKLEDFWLGILMGCLVFSIDVTTILIYLFKKGKKVSSKQKNSVDAGQIRIFVQTILANISLIACCTQFHIIAPYYSETGFTEFILTTFQWMEYHAISGIILGLFYKEMYLHLKKFIIKPKNSVSKIRTQIGGGMVIIDSTTRR